MVRHLHDETMASDADNYAISKAFAMTTGVKQECVFAPILFSLILSAMLTDVYCDERLRIRIDYSTDGHILNSRRMQAPTRLFTTTIHEKRSKDWRSHLEAGRIAVAKVKRTVRKSQAPSIHNVATQSHPTSCTVNDHFARGSAYSVILGPTTAIAASKNTPAPTSTSAPTLTNVDSNPRVTLPPATATYIISATTTERNHLYHHRQ
nr:unnamed protein product [Spirometra erinaceieuropaei]